MTVEGLEAARSQVGSWGHRSRARARLVVEHAEGRVVDVGCGSDAYLSPLEREGHFVLGVDLLAPETWDGIPLVIGDGSCLPLRDGAFDTALCFEVLEHIPDPAAGLKELGRVARRLLLTVPNCEEPNEFAAAGLAFHHWVDRTHVNYFTQNSLSELLVREGWDVLHAGLVHPIAPEVVALTSWWFPPRLARLLAGALKRLPLRRRYYMTIAVVAELRTTESSSARA